LILLAERMERLRFSSKKIEQQMRAMK